MQSFAHTLRTSYNYYCRAYFQVPRQQSAALNIFTLNEMLFSQGRKVPWSKFHQSVVGCESVNGRWIFLLSGQWCFSVLITFSSGIYSAASVPWFSTLPCFHKNPIRKLILGRNNWSKLSEQVYGPGLPVWNWLLIINTQPIDLGLQPLQPKQVFTRCPIYDKSSVRIRSCRHHITMVCSIWVVGPSSGGNWEKWVFEYCFGVLQKRPF